MTPFSTPAFTLSLRGVSHGFDHQAYFWAWISHKNNEFRQQTSNYTTRATSPNTSYFAHVDCFLRLKGTFSIENAYKGPLKNSQNAPKTRSSGSPTLWCRFVALGSRILTTPEDRSRNWVLMWGNLKNAFMVRFKSF